MRALFLFSFLFSSAALCAQPFAIGNRETSYTDAARGRVVPCAIHYPAAVAGDDQPLAEGAFLVIVIGHGFVMSVEAYTYFWQHFVPQGYIVVLPTTEGGISPNHAAFGQDLAFLAARMTDEGADPGSPFFGHVAPGRALAGHSMGGGAALLGAANNTNIDAVLVMAPAETNPSAIAAAAAIGAPTLIFAATEDCVTPIGTNQQPMYAAIVQPCKALVNITGGGHCYFGDDNFLCSFGELTCGPDLSITREEQHTVVRDLGTLWLGAFVRQQPDAWDALVDSLDGSDRYTADYSCLSTMLPAATAAQGVRIRTTANDVVLESAEPISVLGVYDVGGRCVLQAAAQAATRIVLDMRGLPAATYMVQVRHADGRMSAHRFVH